MNSNAETRIQVFAGMLHSAEYAELIQVFLENHQWANIGCFLPKIQNNIEIQISKIEAPRSKAARNALAKHFQNNLKHALLLWKAFEFKAL